MLSATINAAIKSVIRDVLDFFRRTEEALAALGAERRCALRLDRLADRLAGMGRKIDLLLERMHEGEADEAIDSDQTLRESLKSLKEDIREIRCQLSGLRVPGAGARLQRACQRLASVAEATYASADKLQWEIDEYDRTFSG